MLTFTLNNEMKVYGKEIFLLTPHRLKTEAGILTATKYLNELKKLAAKLRDCRSKVVFNFILHDLKALIQNSWIVKVKLKFQRQTGVWPATADSLSKWRSNFVRRVLSANRKSSD